MKIHLSRTRKLCPLLGLALLAAAPVHAAAQRTLRVPEGSGTPVLIDGRFSPGEWQDALAVPIAPGDTLFLHQYRGHVFLGVRTARPYPTYVDLFLVDGEGTVHNLHASMQTGERVLTDTLWTDARPATRWGNERDWTANVSRPLPERRERVSPAPREHFFPQDGREFQLRRSRFPGRLWRLRVEVRDLGGSGAPDVVHPAGSARKDVSGWATLDLGRRGRG